jgi:hypothetical protein
MTVPDDRVVITHYIIAVFHAALGDHDGAIAKLEEAFAIRERHIIMIKVDPRLDELRDDPRFKELYEKVGFPA